MSIRRTTELPSVENFTYGNDSNLSNCLFEVSFQKDGEYKSANVKNTDIRDYIEHVIQSTYLTTLNQSGLCSYILDGRLLLDNSILNLLSGSSILAWPNEPTDGHETCCYLHFDHIKMSSDNEIDIHADGQLKLEGNPVVINNNLTVHTNLTETNNVVNLGSTSNIIWAKTISTDKSSLTNNSNMAVTCQMLKQLCWK